MKNLLAGLLALFVLAQAHAARAQAWLGSAESIGEDTSGLMTDKITLLLPYVVTVFTFLMVIKLAFNMFKRRARA